MQKTFIICPKLDYHKESLEKRQLLDSFISFLKEKLSFLGFKEAVSSNEKIDYVFSLGGDGTMLYCMRNYLEQQSVIIGIHAGNVGFLPPYSMEDILQGNFEELVEKKSYIEKRNVLKGTGNKLTSIAVNEYTISTNEINQMLEFSLTIKQQDKLFSAGKYRAQAVVVSGPCGSTGYNKNVGGCFVDPTLKSMQITQVAPTTLSARPIVISGESSILIKMHSDAKIFLDGISYAQLNKNEEFEISIHPLQSKLLFPKEWNFFEVISTKLFWNNGLLK